MTSPEISPGSNKTVFIAIVVSSVVAVLLLVCGGIFTLVALSVIGGRNALQEISLRLPEDRIRIKNDMRSLALGVLNYESVYKRLPPAYTVDDKGNKLHSWRVLILPYMEEGPLYNSIDLTKPWNHPDNKRAYDAEPPCYVNKSDGLGPGITRYLTVVGPNAVFRGPEQIRMGAIADGLKNTLMFYHTVPSQGVHWMQPDDSSIDEFIAAVRLASRGGPGANATMVDATHHTLGPEVTEQDLRAIVSASGGEIVHLHDQ